MKSVVTYINSGNIIFVDRVHTKPEILELLGKAILKDFGLNIKVLVRNLVDFDNIMKILPESWKNDQEMKGNVLFLGEEIDLEKVQAKLIIKPDIDMVLFAPGAYCGLSIKRM